MKEPFVSANRWQVARYIQTPLGFYVLALLIVEAFLMGAGIAFDVSETIRVILIIVGIVLFAIVIAIVTLLVVKLPRNLVFSEQSHIKYETLRMYGDNANPMLDDFLEAVEKVPPPIPPAGQLPSAGV